MRGDDTLRLDAHIELHVISVTDNVPAVPACRQASFWPGVTVK